MSVSAAWSPPGGAWAPRVSCPERQTPWGLTLIMEPWNQSSPQTTFSVCTAASSQMQKDAF